MKLSYSKCSAERLALFRCPPSAVPSSKVWMVPKNPCRGGICQCQSEPSACPVDADELTKPLCLLKRPNSKCSSSGPSTCTSHSPLCIRVSGVREPCSSISITVGKALKESKQLHFCWVLGPEKKRHVSQPVGRKVWPVVPCPSQNCPSTTGSSRRLSWVSPPPNPLQLCAFIKIPSSSQSSRLCYLELSSLFPDVPCSFGLGYPAWGRDFGGRTPPRLLLLPPSVFWCRHPCTGNSEGGTP